jgi:hypothetical protein
VVFLSLPSFLSFFLPFFISSFLSFSLSLSLSSFLSFSFQMGVARAEDRYEGEEK